MSEDRVSFYFESDPSAASIEHAASRVTAPFEHGDRRVRELTYEKKRNACYVSFWADFREDGEDIRSALIDLQRRFDGRPPYAEIEMDQTGDVAYQALIGDQVVSFDAKDALLAHLESAGKMSVEEKLLGRARPGSTLILVRLRFDKKRPLQAYARAVSDFVASRDEACYKTFKTLIDSNAWSGKDIDYPATKLWRDEFAKKNMDPNARAAYFELLGSMGDDESEEDFTARIEPEVAALEAQRYETEPLSRSALGDLALGRALSGYATDKRFLILLFEHETAFGIVPCAPSDATWHARNNIKNGEGYQVLELLECLLMQTDIDTLSAKLYSPLSEASASFFSNADTIECTPWFDNEPLAPAVWPTPC